VIEPYLRPEQKFNDTIFLSCRYAYGSVSSKIDVYAFGVVLYELISAKGAVIMGGDSGADLKGLVVLVILHSLLLIIFSKCSLVIFTLENIFKTMYVYIVNFLCLIFLMTCVAV
jgi:serine/threonine protein kinase